MAISEDKKNKLVSLGALDAVATALKGAANQAAAAAEAEAERAKKAEQAIEGKADENAAAIAILNGDAEGSVAAAVKAEENRAVVQEGLLADRIAAVEGVVGEAGKLAEVEGKANANAAAIAVLNGGEDVEGSVAKAVKVAKDAADTADAKAVAADAKAVAAQADVDAIEERLDNDGGLVDRIEAVEALGAKLDGAVGDEGSVKKQIKDAIDAVDQAAGLLEARVKANEDDIVEMKAEEAKIRVDFAAADTKVREDFAAADVTNLQAAKDYADQQITALVASAPDAMNTLKELADAIDAHQDVYDAYVAEHATAMTNLKTELQGEIDADVEAEAELRDNADKLLQEAINAKVAQADYDAKMKLVDEKDAAQDGRLAILEGLVVGGEGEGGLDKITADIAANATAAANAHAAANTAQADVDAVEEILNGEDGLIAKVAANATAIENEVKENGARDAAIAAAVGKHDTEVRAMLATVINSLGISIENNQLKLTLGTSDYVIKTAQLDVASDTDITELLNSLQ